MDAFYSTHKQISAKQTESFMINKDITCAETLQTALEILSKEINPNYLPIASSQEHRKSLAVNLFYKVHYINDICQVSLQYIIFDFVN